MISKEPTAENLAYHGMLCVLKENWTKLDNWKTKEVAGMKNLSTLGEQYLKVMSDRKKSPVKLLKEVPKGGQETGTKVSCYNNL